MIERQSPIDLVVALIRIINGEAPRLAAGQILDPEVELCVDSQNYYGIDVWYKWIYLIRNCGRVGDLPMSQCRVYCDARDPSLVHLSAQWTGMVRSRRTVDQRNGEGRYLIRDGRIRKIWTRGRWPKTCMPRATSCCAMHSSRRTWLWAEWTEWTLENVGLTRAVTKRAVEFAKARHQFGKPIAAFQSIQHKLVEMHTMVRAMSPMSAHSTSLLENEVDATEQVCMAKYYCAEQLQNVVASGMRVWGDGLISQQKKWSATTVRRRWRFMPGARWRSKKISLPG